MEQTNLPNKHHWAYVKLMHVNKIKKPHVIYFNPKSPKSIFQIIFQNRKGWSIYDDDSLEIFCCGVDSLSAQLDFALKNDDRKADDPKITKRLKHENYNNVDYIEVESFVRHPKEFCSNKGIQSILLSQFDQEIPTLQNDFINGTFYEYGMIYEKDNTKALEFYKRGFQINECHECAVALLRYHIEPVECNDHNPILDFEMALSIFAAIFKRSGFIQLMTLEQNYMPLLQLLYIYLDLYEDMRKIVLTISQKVRKLCKTEQMKSFQTIDYSSLAKLIKHDRTENLLDEFVIYILTEPDFYCAEFIIAIKTLEILGEDNEFSKINNLLGDLQDPSFQGNEIYWCFQKRLRYYCLGGSITKIFILTTYVYLHYEYNVNKTRQDIIIQDCQKLGSVLEKSMHPQYQIFLIEYYIRGGNLGLDITMPTFYQKFYNIAEISLQDTFGFETDSTNFFNDIDNTIKTDLESLGLKDSTLEIDPKVHRNNFFNSKIIKRKELTSQFNIVSFIGRKQYLFMFFELIKRMDSEGTNQIAVRIGNLGTNLDCLALSYLYEKNGSRTDQKYVKCLRAYKDILQAICDDQDEKDRSEKGKKISSKLKQSLYGSYSFEQFQYRIFKVGENVKYEHEVQKYINQIVLIFLFDSVEKDIFLKNEASVQNALILGKFLKRIGMADLGESIIGKVLLLNGKDFVDKAIIYNNLVRKYKKLGPEFETYMNTIFRPCNTYFKSIDYHMNKLFIQRWKPFSELFSNFAALTKIDLNETTETIDSHLNTYQKIWNHFEHSNQFFSYFSDKTVRSQYVANLNDSKLTEKVLDFMDQENPLNCSWIFSTSTPPNDQINIHVSQEIRMILESVKKKINFYNTYQKPLLCKKVACKYILKALKIEIKKLERGYKNIIPAHISLKYKKDVLEVDQGPQKFFSEFPSNDLAVNPNNKKNAPENQIHEEKILNNLVGHLVNQNKNIQTSRESLDAVDIQHQNANKEITPKSDLNKISKDVKDKFVKIGQFVYDKFQKINNAGLHNVSIFNGSSEEESPEKLPEPTKNNIKNLEDMFDQDAKKLASSGWRLTDENFFQLENHIKSINAIRIIKNEDITMLEQEGILSPFNIEILTENKVNVRNGFFKENNQQFTRFDIQMHSKSHLSHFFHNLKFMELFNPLYVNFYGLSMENKKVFFKISIYSERISSTLYDFYSTKEEQKKLKNKKKQNDINEKINQIYTLAYSVLNAYSLHLPIYYLNLETVVLTPQKEHKVLIPFFVEKFDNPAFYTGNLPYETLAKYNFSGSVLSVALHPLKKYVPNEKIVIKPLETGKPINSQFLFTQKKTEVFRTKKFSISQSLKFSLGSIQIFMLLGKHVYIDTISKFTINEDYLRKAAKIKDYVKRINSLQKDIKNLYNFSQEFLNCLFNLQFPTKKDCGILKIVNELEIHLVENDLEVYNKKLYWSSMLKTISQKDLSKNSLLNMFSKDSSNELLNNVKYKLPNNIDFKRKESKNEKFYFNGKKVCYGYNLINEGFEGAFNYIDLATKTNLKLTVKDEKLVLCQVMEYQNQETNLKKENHEFEHFEGGLWILKISEIKDELIDFFDDNNEIINQPKKQFSDPNNSSGFKVEDISKYKFFHKSLQNMKRYNTPYYEGITNSMLSSFKENFDFLIDVLNMNFLQRKYLNLNPVNNLNKKNDINKSPARQPVKNFKRKMVNFYDCTEYENALREKLKKEGKNFDFSSNKQNEIYIKDSMGNFISGAVPVRKTKFKIYDPFGNIMYGTFVDEFIDMDEGLVIKSQLPPTLPNMYSYYPVKNKLPCYFYSNIISYGVHDFEVSPKSCLNLIQKIGQGTTRFSIIYYVLDKKQFTGEIKDGKPFKGVIYDKYRNYKTYSNQLFYTGEICYQSNKIKYFGTIFKNLPHGYGQLWINNKLVYMGYFAFGECTGNGYIFTDKEQVKFFGIIRNGMPVEGIFIEKKRVFEGEIYHDENISSNIINKDSYDTVKHSIFESNNILTQLKKANRLTSFFKNYEFIGNIINFSDTIFKAEGNFISPILTLNGHYKLHYMNGSVYTGKMKNFNRKDEGKFVRNDGMTMIGNWTYPYFSGIISMNLRKICYHESKLYPNADHRDQSTESEKAKENIEPKSFQESVLLSTNQEEVSHAQLHKKLDNDEPVFYSGKFKYDTSGNITLNGYSMIKFKSGNVYKGVVVNNMIDGIGSMKYANGLEYKGMWKKGKKNGFGYQNLVHSVYEGQFKNDTMHGYGVLITKTKVIRGYWRKNMQKYAMIKFREGVAAEFNTRSINIVLKEPIHVQNDLLIQNLRGTIEMSFNFECQSTHLNSHKNNNVQNKFKSDTQKPFTKSIIIGTPKKNKDIHKINKFAVSSNSNKNEKKIYNITDNSQNKSTIIKHNKSLIKNIEQDYGPNSLITSETKIDTKDYINDPAYYKESICVSNENTLNNNTNQNKIVEDLKIKAKQDGSLNLDKSDSKLMSLSIEDSIKMQRNNQFISEKNLDKAGNEIHNNETKQHKISKYKPSYTLPNNSHINMKKKAQHYQITSEKNSTKDFQNKDKKQASDNSIEKSDKKSKDSEENSKASSKQSNSNDIGQLLKRYSNTKIAMEKGSMEKFKKPQCDSIYTNEPLDNKLENSDAEILYLRLQNSEDKSIKSLEKQGERNNTETNAMAPNNSDSDQSNLDERVDNKKPITSQFNTLEANEKKNSSIIEQSNSNLNEYENESENNEKSNVFRIMKNSNSKNYQKSTSSTTTAHFLKHQAKYSTINELDESKISVSNASIQNNLEYSNPKFLNTNSKIAFNKRKRSCEKSQIFSQTTNKDPGTTASNRRKSIATTHNDNADQKVIREYSKIGKSTYKRSYSLLTNKARRGSKFSVGLKTDMSGNKRTVSADKVNSILNEVSKVFGEEKHRKGSFCETANYTQAHNEKHVASYTFVGELSGPSLKCSGKLKKNSQSFMKGNFSNFFKNNFGIKWNAIKHVEEMGEFQNFKLHNLAIRQSTNKRVEGTFIRGVLDNIVVCYKTNSLITSWTGTYKDGKKHGFFIKYWRDSKAVTEYDSGKLIHINYFDRNITDQKKENTVEKLQVN